MKFKKFMALAMAGVMTLGMTATSFAKDITEPEEISNNKVTLIEKSIKANEGVELPDGGKTFTFAVGEDESVTATFTSISGTPTISEFDVSSLQTPGVYEYPISEKDITGTDAADWTKDSSEYTLKVYVQNTGTDADGKAVLKKSYAIFKGEGEEQKKTDSAAFENIYEPISGDETTGSITVKKVVEHPEWSKVNKYSFKVTLVDKEYAVSDLSKFIEKVTVAKAAGSEGDVTNIVKNADGTITFDLTDKAVVQITGVPQGIDYTVEETTTAAEMGEAPYYKGTSYKVGSDEGNGFITDTLKTQKDVTEVVFTNKFADDITPTGLAISVAPFVAMFAAVGAAIALYVAAKRRVR